MKREHLNQELKRIGRSPEVNAQNEYTKLLIELLSVTNEELVILNESSKKKVFKEKVEEAGSLIDMVSILETLNLLVEVFSKINEELAALNNCLGEIKEMRDFLEEIRDNVQRPKFELKDV